MNTASKSRVSCMSITEVLGKLVERNKLRLLPYQNGWANGTGYFDGLVNSSAEVVGIEEGEVAAAIDHKGRFLLIGVLDGLICVAFQRYEVEAGKSNSTIILQLQSEDENPMAKVIGDTHGPIFFEDLLTFIRQFRKNGQPIADSLYGRLHVTVPESEIAAAVGVAAAITSNAETSNSTSSQDNTMNNASNATTTTAADTVADVANNAAGQAAPTAGDVKSDTAAASDAIKDAAEAVTDAANAAAQASRTATERALDIIRQSTGNIKKRDAAFFGGGLVAGVVATLAVRAIFKSE